MRKLYLSVAYDKEDRNLAIVVADNFWTRFKGLLGTSSLQESQGLLLCNCNSVHMVGMRYALDIIYLDKAGAILKIVENLNPWQISCCWKAQDTLEIKSGMIHRFGWQVGMELQWHK
ncbi:MAG: hypothetical protein H6Q70_2930 [Firmicutes bacterium]|nr:hypothetical protein [Bacillota bacterium]